MAISRPHLISRYVAEMHEGDAALFIGAGMSRDSGFVDWKGLIEGLRKGTWSRCRT